MPWLYLIAGFLFGFLLIKYSRQVQGILGKNLWAEAQFGPGGTQTLIKVSGIIIMFTGLFFWANGAAILSDMVQSIFGGAAPEGPTSGS